MKYSKRDKIALLHRACERIQLGIYSLSESDIDDISDDLSHAQNSCVAIGYVRLYGRSFTHDFLPKLHEKSKRHRIMALLFIAAMIEAGDIDRYGFLKG